MFSLFDLTPRGLCYGFAAMGLLSESFCMTSATNAGSEIAASAATASASHATNGVPAASTQRIQANRAQVAEVRARARRLFDSGATGVQIAHAISEGIEGLLASFHEHAWAALNPADQAAVSEHTAIIAVGGTGRGDLAPHSDVDLLFLHAPSAARVQRDFFSSIVRDFWDAQLKLGHAVRTIGDTISLARADAQVATALTEARLLRGSQPLFEKLQRGVHRKAFGGRARHCLTTFFEARQTERSDRHATGFELEPDVKKSLGGLRDLHLLRWLCFVVYGTTDFESLKLRGAFTRDEALALGDAHEFLSRVRADLHFAAGKPQDKLTRDEQLRIAEQRGITGTPGMRPVERFMREYFRQSTAILRVLQRFLATHDRPPPLRRAMRSLMMHRVENDFRAGDGVIDALSRRRDAVCSKLESILKLYSAGVRYGFVPDPALVERIRDNVPQLPRELSDESATLFMTLMGCSGRLGAALRSLYDCGVLELIVPSMVHARCLLQFNQYHHYTVDEHTFRVIEECEKFNLDPGPIGQAYRQIRNKGVLHLALLLHDLGKGFEEDHSEVGRQLAEQMSVRLRLSERDTQTLVYLVHQHLRLATIAFRNDLDDPKLLVPLSKEIGSVDTLRMLYVLTAADISGVGPGVFNAWKAELLTGLHDRLMHLLSGQRPAQFALERLQRVTDQVALDFATPSEDPAAAQEREWARTQLSTLPSHYLLSVPSERVVADLRVFRRLKAGAVEVESHYLPETESVEYRVVADAAASAGCFHKIAGTLTAKRMEILSAQISTTTAGTVLDTFRVVDRDFRGEAPPERTEDVAAAIRQVLAGGVDPETLFQKGRRYGATRHVSQVSDLPMKVVVDNESSDRCTIVSVFAHDRTGLLYTVTRGLYELGLSVMLAKISTHFDQVVDVFYVAEPDGSKVADEARLTSIRDDLTHRILAFETHGWQRFA